MEFELGFDRFENIKSNAHWARVHIDTRLVPDTDSTRDYMEHLRDCNNHPTTGLLARRKCITSKPINYPYHARNNLSIMRLHPTVNELEKSFKDKLKTLYPRTMAARKYIINNDRVKLDYIEPAKKYNFMNKIAIFCKKFM